DNAWAEGVGERLAPVALPPAWYLLVAPAIHVSTAELFQAPELTRDAAPATISDFASGALLGNAFEPVLRRREPAVEAVVEVLARVGTSRLAGTGSGCFVDVGVRASVHVALFQVQWEMLQGRVPVGLQAWIAEGTTRSPLHVALDAYRL